MPKQRAVVARSRTTALRRDIDFYRGLATHVGLPPTPFMLPFMGENADALARRRAPDVACWRAFRSDVTGIHPSLPVWTPTTAKDGKVLSSVVERLAYEALQPRLPASVTLILHPVIAAARKWTADFALVKDGQGTVTYVEVAGLLASDWRPRTAREAGYETHFRAKLAAYADAGLPRPVIIHVDEVCDPARLRNAIDGVLAAVEGAAA